MSIGFMTDEQQPIIWRGPMVAHAIRDFLEKVAWGKLDYLVVDLPPGTGDPLITIAQTIPDAGIVIVTTPQKLAVADVKRAATMFRKMGKTVMGIVENMSYFCCGHSEEKIEIFGKGGGAKLCRELDIPLLGALPIDIALRKSGDEGIPLMVELPDCDTAQIFTELPRATVSWTPSRARRSAVSGEACDRLTTAVQGRAKDRARMRSGVPPPDWR